METHNSQTTSWTNKSTIEIDQPVKVNMTIYIHLENTKFLLRDFDLNNRPMAEKR